MIVSLLPKWLRRENSYVKDSESSGAEGTINTAKELLEELHHFANPR